MQKAKIDYQGLKKFRTRQSNPSFTLNDGFVLPDDPAKRVMVSFHNYTPYAFCQTGEANDWGHTRRSNLSDSNYSEDFHKEICYKFYKAYVEKGVPVYMGEFGCTNRTDATARKFQLYWLEYVSKCAKIFGISGFIWENGAVGSNGETYGIINHETGEYLDPVYSKQIVEACSNGFYKESGGYTLESVYNKAPKY